MVTLQIPANCPDVTIYISTLYPETDSRRYVTQLEIVIKTVEITRLIGLGDTVTKGASNPLSLSSQTRVTYERKSVEIFPQSYLHCLLITPKVSSHST